MKCPKCKRKIPDDSILCLYCGNANVAEAQNQTLTEAKHETDESKLAEVNNGSESNTELIKNEDIQEERGENIRLDTLIKQYASSVYVLVPAVCLSLYVVFGIFGDPPHPITVIIKFIASFFGVSLGGLDYILDELLNAGISLLFSGLRNFGRFVRLIEHIPGILIVGSLFSIYFSAKKSDRFKPINPTATALIYYVILWNGIFKCIAYVMALAGIIELTSMFSDGISDIAGTAIFVVAILVAIQIFFIGKLLQCVKVLEYTHKKQYDKSGIPGFIIGYCLVTGILGILASAIGGMSIFVNSLASVFFGLGLAACKNDIEKSMPKKEFRKLSHEEKKILVTFSIVSLCVALVVGISVQVYRRNHIVFEDEIKYTLLDNGIAKWQLGTDGKYVYAKLYRYYTGNKNTNIRLPDNIEGVPVIQLGANFMEECHFAESIVIPDSVRVIENEAFRGCRNITSINIPASVSEIGDNVFMYCDSLENITVSKDNKKFRSVWGVLYSMNKYMSLEHLMKYPSGKNDNEYIIPADVKYIDSYSFEGANNLTNVIIPDSVTGIAESAFKYCEKLQTIRIPDGVKTIGNDAFYACENLTSCIIGNTVTTLGTGVFQDCDNLNTVIFLGDVPEVWNGNIGSIEKLFYIEGSKGWSAPTWVSPSENTYNSFSVVVDKHENLAKMSYDTLLIKFLSAQRVDEFPGDDTSAQRGDEFPCGDNLTWTVDLSGNLVINGKGEMQESPWLPDYQDLITSVTISEGVTSICEDAFIACNYLISISLPDSLMKIGARAFSDCSGITDVVVPKNVSIIEYEAFKNCKELLRVDIKSPTVEFGGWIFADCSKLKDVKFNENITSISNLMFYGCASLKNIILPENLTFIGNSAFKRCTSLLALSIPSGVSYIGEQAFLGCENIINITLPKQLRGVEDGVFWGCTALQSVEIPDTITQIGSEAFKDCKSLQKIIIPDTVTKLGSQAFLNCINLSEINISKGLTKIEDEVFLCCTKLSKVELPEGVERIGEHAFSGCDSLTSIILPNTLTWIDDFAFSECPSLESITIPSNVKEFGKRMFLLCTNIKDVFFEGDAPGNYCGFEDIFYNANPDVTIRYLSTAKGWTNKSWRGPDGIYYNTKPYAP